MKFISLLAISAMFFFSCTPYYQVFETQPLSDNIIKDAPYRFENDTVRIEYNFWDENGVMHFSIYNKLNVPLYIDWKKSSFLVNGERLDYWRDETRVNSVSVSKGRVRIRPNIWSDLSSSEVTSSSSLAVKNERITFIPPHSDIYNDEYSLFIGKMLRLGRHTKMGYNHKTTPLVFRNFFTISASENFQQETYVSNEFYVTMVSQLDKESFFGKSTGRKNGIFLYELPFKSPTAFYLKTN